MATRTTDNRQVYYTKETTGNYTDIYYDYADGVAKSYFAPQGWRVTSFADFNNIKATLTANSVTHISTGQAFFPDADGGVLGFYHRNTGICVNPWDLGWERQNYGSAGFYWCRRKADSKYEGECMIKFGSFYTGDNAATGDRMSVRLVQDIY